MKYVSFCFVDVDVVGVGAVVDVVVHGAVVVDFLNTEVSGVEPLDYSARSSGYPPGVSFVARNYSIGYCYLFIAQNYLLLMSVLCMVAIKLDFPVICLCPEYMRKAQN